MKQINKSSVLIDIPVDQEFEYIVETNIIETSSLGRYLIPSFFLEQLYEMADQSSISRSISKIICLNLQLEKCVSLAQESNVVVFVREQKN